MDRHRPLQQGVGRLVVHEVEDPVNDLVAPGREQGGAEDLLAIDIGQYLHKPSRLAFFDGTTDAGHRARRDQGGFAAALYLGLRHSSPAERRIDIERVGGNAITDPARVPVEEVCGDDFEIIISGVGEGAFAVAVAERPHPFYVGAQLIVDENVAVLVLSDTGRVEPEIVGVRATADRQHQVRPTNFGWPLRAIEADEDIVAAPREPDAFRLDAQGYAFPSQTLAYPH